MEADKTSEDNSLFKRVIQTNDKSGELKNQFTIDLTSYDTSKMPGYKEGRKVAKGFSCRLSTIKVNKAHPKSRIDIDPANKEIRKAIEDMYKTFDSQVSGKK